MLSLRMSGKTPSNHVGGSLESRPYRDPVGTCRIGSAEDPDAVVDEAGRVHGIENLSVVDASIMPSIPSANTNLPTLMLAERASELI